MQMIRHISKDHCLLGLLATANIALHLGFFNTLGFHRDELLYFSLGQHPAAGYASVPPFTGFIAWLVIQTMGYSLFAARLLPALLSGAYVLVGAGIAREMGGGKFARILTALGIIVTPLNLRGFYLFQPVCWDLFFWALMVFVVLRWINTGNNRYLLLAGIVAGTGMMNKYLIFLLIFCLSASFLISRYRLIFRQRQFFLALVVALLILLPNIIWQIGHNFPVMTHMKALNDTQLVHVNRVAFFTDQLLIGSMALILILPGIAFGLFGNSQRKWRPVLVASIAVLLLLAIMRGKSYYSAGLLPIWIAAGAVFWETRVKTPAGRSILAGSLLVFTLPLAPVGIPVCSSGCLQSYFAWLKEKAGLDMPLRWENGRLHKLPQDYADMLGWDEIASLTARAYDQVIDKPSVLIFAQNYGQAGAIMVLGKKYGLPEPVCFSESFYYWFPRKLPRKITTVIYVNDELGEDVRRLFGKIQVVGVVTDPLARESGTTIWICSDPLQNFNDFWSKAVSTVESPFE
jgi:hypothetical protein